jgi:predicted metallopeptidase
MKARIIKHLVSQKKFDLVVVKDIVCMLASRSSNGSSKGVAKVLGVDKRNIQKAMGR